jgi:hypothetical protein
VQAHLLQGWKRQTEHGQKQRREEDSGKGEIRAKIGGIYCQKSWHFESKLDFLS